MEWVPVAVVDDHEAARSEVGYLRSRGVLARIGGQPGRYRIEVRSADEDQVRRLRRAKATVAEGRLPALPPVRARRRLARSGLVVGVAVVLLLAVVPTVVIVGWFGYLFLGTAGMSAALVATVAFVVWAIMDVRFYRKTFRRLRSAFGPEWEHGGTTGWQGEKWRSWRNIGD